MVNECRRMKRFTLDNQPNDLAEYRKKSVTLLSFQTEPFVVETQEGNMVISPETTDDWDEGYYIAYPSDGSKPYSISPSFVRDNYCECR
jgi:hypothetical protein